MATDDTNLLLSRLDALSKEVELVRTEQKLNAVQTTGVSAASPWYVKWGQILGIPAVIVVILMNWGQIGLNNGTAQKTEAETVKVRVETLKTQAELQKALDDLEKERAKAPTSAALNETIDRLRQTLSDAIRLRQSEVTGALTNIFVRWVVIWFVLQWTGLFFSIALSIWNVTYVTIVTMANTAISRLKGPAGRFLKLVLPISIPIFSITPNIVNWSIQLFILFSLSQPLAYDAAVILGRPAEFTAFTTAVNQRRFHEAGNHLLALLTGS